MENPETHTEKAPVSRRNGRKAGGDKGGATLSPRLHGDLLSSSLLAFLRRVNAYGYQLVQELSKAGLAQFDSTTVYRTLRHLERAGLVSSFWDMSESGPARRMYALTKAGEAFLDVWIDMFTRYQKVLNTALDRLDNFENSSDNSVTETLGPEASQRRGRNARS
jgi:poly-beta-hydroxybutyrate-responsive repressor